MAVTVGVFSSMANDSAASVLAFSFVKNTVLALLLVLISLIRPLRLSDSCTSRSPLVDGPISASISISSTDVASMHVVLARV